MAASGKKAAHDIHARKRTGDVLLTEQVDFGSLLLSEPVLKGLSAAGFERPSPIQLKAIPLGRCGLDLIVQAKSGTGKTCVFSTIALDSLILENPSTQVLVLAPTREIAVQIHSVIIAIGIEMERLECHVFIGGTPLNQDKVRLKKCHIAVGSPGRIKQLIEIGYLATASIRLFVLDEADKLLEEGSFQEQINWIYSSLPVNKQMLALSATYPESLAHHLTRYMRDPSFVRLNPTDPGLIGLKQYYKVVNSHPLPHKTFEEKVRHLLELFSKLPFNQALVFSNLHSRAQHLADILTSKGLPAVCISGNMNQNQRLEAMAKLKQFHCRVLISTDLTSRGIDAEKVNLVINLDIPQDWETYMHRIGRAGRFGTHGLAVTYCCRGEEENEIMRIAQKCNLQISCLPDPIPPGLMEELPCWDAEITMVPNPNLAATEPSVTKTATYSRLELQSNDSVTHKVKNKMPELKNTVKQKHSIKHEKLTKKETKRNKVMNLFDSSPESKQKNLSSLAGKHSNNPQPQQSIIQENIIAQTKDQKAQKDLLPKISPLPSFKTKMSVLKPYSFNELVKDYEHFVKEGLEKPVEIVRQYTISSKVAKQEPAEEVVSRENESSVYSDQDRSTGRNYSYSDSDSESDSRLSSSGASVYSTGSKKSLSEGFCNMENEEEQQTMDTSNPVGKCSSTENHSYSNDGYHSYFFSTTSSKSHKADKAPSPKRNPETQQNQKRKSRAFSQSKKGNNTVIDSEHNSSEFNSLSEDHLHSDYWKAYFQAWHSYYASMRNPYYENYWRRSNWMTAYQMNTVYMQELLKKE
uniref:Probable ATP-dependent RNA helicase DDX20 n=1 Tax=Latimeria chalumnae TaxID=7897 RepID=H3BGM6_LATCH